MISNLNRMSWLFLTFFLNAFGSASHAMLKLCADGAGNHISCPRSSAATSKGGGGTGSGNTPAEAVGAAATTLIPVFNQIGNLLNTWEQEESERAWRYRPRDDTNVLEQQRVQANFEKLEFERQAQIREAETERKLKAQSKDFERTQRQLLEAVDLLDQSIKNRASPGPVPPRTADEEQMLFEISERKQGRFPDTDLKKFTDALEQKLLHGNDIEDALAQLGAIQKFQNEAFNPTGKAQIQELLSRFLDAQGLVQDWASKNKHLANISLSSDRGSPFGSQVRKMLNRLLMQEHLGNPQDNLVWELILKADQESSERHYLQARKYYTYLNKTRDLRYYKSQKMPETLASSWGLGPVDASTFEGSEIIEVAQEFSKLAQISEDEVVRLHVILPLKSAQEAANERNTKKFINAIDQTWKFINQYRGAEK